MPNLGSLGYYMEMAYTEDRTENNSGEEGVQVTIQAPARPALRATSQLPG